MVVLNTRGGSYWVINTLLDSLSNETMLAIEVDDVVQRSGAAVSLNLDVHAEVGPAEREAILRVAREAAINAVRHGGAKTIRITLARRAAGETRLQIEDDGIGFDQHEVSAGFGLTTMKERVESTGGTLRVESARGTGTSIEADWGRRPAKPTAKARQEADAYA
jgi:signal transduction histidine kinase